jgi:hypothetical protein
MLAQNTQKKMKVHCSNDDAKMDPMFFLVHRLMHVESKSVNAEAIKGNVSRKKSDQETLKQRYNDIEFWLTVGIYV